MPGSAYGQRGPDKQGCTVHCSTLMRCIVVEYVVIQQALVELQEVGGAHVWFCLQHGFEQQTAMVYHVLNYCEQSCSLTCPFPFSIILGPLDDTSNCHLRCANPLLCRL